MPIYDKTHNLYLYFKAQARSNETGVEHAAKSYHGLQPSDVEMLVKNINKPLLFAKDKRHKHVFNYYLKRKEDKKNAIKISVLIDKDDPHRAEILKAAKEEGLELTDEQLEAVSGGACVDVICPKCSGPLWSYTKCDGVLYYECPHCGHKWSEVDD